jgi:hypothetical protein
MKQMQAPALRCPLCDGTGWRPVRLSNGDRAVTRCECRRPEQEHAATNIDAIDGKSAAAGDER